MREAVHLVPASQPYRKRRLTESECEALEQAMEALAGRLRHKGEDLGDAIARVVPEALTYWMRNRPGRDNYLVRECHPLHELPLRDLDWLVAEMLRRRPANAAAHVAEDAPLPTLEQLEASRQLIAARGGGTVAAIAKGEQAGLQGAPIRRRVAA